MNFECFSAWYFHHFLYILVSNWLPKASAADTLFASLFDTFATLFRKGVFEGSLARFGFLFIPFWLPFISLLISFWFVLAPFWLPWLV